MKTPTKKIQEIPTFIRSPRIIESINLEQYQEFKKQVIDAGLSIKEQENLFSRTVLQQKIQLEFARAGEICVELAKQGVLILLANGYVINLSNNDINRFVYAQNGIIGNYSQALKEIEAGQKTSHWIWYIFPQLRVFGHSETALYYGISDKGEAERYLAHPILGTRIREISQVLLKHKGKTALQIFGNLDAKKVRSCMTMFDSLSPNDVFGEVLDAFYNGERGKRTLKEMSRIDASK